MNDYGNQQERKKVNTAFDKIPQRHHLRDHFGLGKIKKLKMEITKMYDGERFLRMNAISGV